MIAEENTNVKQPVTKKIYEQGGTAVGVWRQMRKQGIKYSYAQFMGTIAGRVRCKPIEEFLISQGLGPELRYAQEREAANG